MYRYLSKKSFSSNPFQSKTYKQLKVGSDTFNYYDISKLGASISKNYLLKNRSFTLFDQSSVGECFKKLR